MKRELRQASRRSGSSSPALPSGTLGARAETNHQKEQRERGGCAASSAGRACPARGAEAAAFYGCYGRQAGGSRGRRAAQAAYRGTRTLAVQERERGRRETRYERRAQSTATSASPAGR